jgi:large subunit ribosomal protein L37Ae
MTRRTKKIGVAGRYGPRYGVRTRKQIATVIRSKSKAYECPSCRHRAVRRVSTGIWKCRKCNLKFAGGAYSPKTSAAGTAAGGKREGEVVVISDVADTEEEEE